VLGVEGRDGLLVDEQQRHLHVVGHAARLEDVTGERHEVVTVDGDLLLVAQEHGHRQVSSACSRSSS
jgi:RNase P/RNase MRP subunit p29